MEYNTQREKIVITDYGRNVFKLVQYAKSVEDRVERTRVAEAIVGVMAQVNPHVREQSDYKRKLWDHLMIMAGGELDVDTPFEVEHREAVRFEPERMSYNQGSIRYRHYGRYTERMLEHIAQMKESEERTELTDEVAQDMKRKYMSWNNDSVDDRVIKGQIESMTGGRVRMDEGREIVLPSANSQQPENTTERTTKKKKKKKK